MAEKSNWLFYVFYVSFPVVITLFYLKCIFIYNCKGLLKITSQLNLSKSFFDSAEQKQNAVLVSPTIANLVLESLVVLAWRDSGMTHYTAVAFSNKPQANPLLDSASTNWTSSFTFSFICGQSQDFSKEFPELAHASILAASEI